MLFYVQMRWNYQGRISQDQLWDLEALEGVHGVEGIRAGFVQLYKVVSQHRIIAIVNADSLENLDRNSMGWLPMREFLEFEQVGAARLRGLPRRRESEVSPARTARGAAGEPATVQSRRYARNRHELVQEPRTRQVRRCPQARRPGRHLGQHTASAGGQRPRVVARLLSRLAGGPAQLRRFGQRIPACWPSGLWASR